MIVGIAMHPLMSTINAEEKDFGARIACHSNMEKASASKRGMPAPNWKPKWTTIVHATHTSPITITPTMVMFTTIHHASRRALGIWS